jgi:hypothetical protein
MENWYGSSLQKNKDVCGMPWNFVYQYFNFGEFCPFHYVIDSTFSSQCINSLFVSLWLSILKYSLNIYNSLLNSFQCGLLKDKECGSPSVPRPPFTSTASPISCMFQSVLKTCIFKYINSYVYFDCLFVKLNWKV